MKLKLLSLSVCLLFGFHSMTNAQKKLNFPSLDGLLITADLYEVSAEAEMIVLCHQAGWSRGEYLETAKWLNDMGYNCLAIDQRSGKGVNEVENETAALAKSKKLKQSYLDAEQDICAAVQFAAERSGKDVILVGSSYSASLVLKVAAEHDGIKAVAAFSPGEYFGAQMSLAEKIGSLSLPTFITCSPDEVKDTQALAEKVEGTEVTFFAPENAGEHGSRALWTSKNGHEAYRNAFKAWLESL